MHYVSSNLPKMCAVVKKLYYTMSVPPGRNASTRCLAISIMHMTFLCVRHTPFGIPVDPLVYRMVDTLSKSVLVQSKLEVWDVDFLPRARNSSHVYTWIFFGIISNDFL